MNTTLHNPKDKYQYIARFKENGLLGSRYVSTCLPGMDLAVIKFKTFIREQRKAGLRWGRITQLTIEAVGGEK